MLFEVARQQKHHGIAIYYVAVAVGKECAVGVAIKADAQIGGPRQHFPRNNLRVQRAAVLIDVAPVRRAMRELRMRARALEYFRSNRAGRAVGTVHNNVQAFSSGERTRQPVQVIRAQRLIAGKRRPCRLGGAWRDSFIEKRKDFVFDFQFNPIRQLIAIRAKDFDAVIAPGIVRSGNHHARGKAVRVRKVSDGGCRDHAGAGVSTPVSRSPQTSSSAIHPLDSRVSCPMTTRRGPEGR